MLKIPVKLLVSILQIRCIQTEASKSLKPTLKLAATADLISRSKKNEAATLKLAQKEKTVIEFLRAHQFSDTQIAKLIESHPAIVRYKVGRNLEPKFEFLQQIGFKSTLMTELIVKTPTILRRSLNAHLIPSIDYLRTLLVENNEVNLVNVIKRATWLLTNSFRTTVQPNVELLLNEGVPLDNVKKLFTSQPRCLLRTSDTLINGIEKVKEFGIEPSQRMFIHALKVFSMYSEDNLNKKMEFMKSLGWSDEDMVSTILHHPFCLTCSVDKLKATVDYLVKSMKVEPVVVIANPKLFMYSLEKRTIPRCKVFVALQKKRLVEETMLPSFLFSPEENFVDRYIVKYLENVPGLLDAYQGWKMDGVGVQR